MKGFSGNRSDAGNHAFVTKILLAPKRNYEAIYTSMIWNIKNPENLNTSH